MKKDTPGREVVADIMRRYPTHSHMAIARAAFATWPEVFPTLDAARSVVRVMVGSKGVKTRKANPYKPMRDGNYRTPLPESKAVAWVPFDLEARRILVLSDVHIPFQDQRALIAALKWGDKVNPDCVFLNGDTADFYTVSRYETDPRVRDFVGEVKAVRQFLAHIRDRYPKARIVYKLGNHDERWLSYLYRKAPELLGLDVTGFESIIEADKVGAEIVADKRIVRIGKLNVLHGHELPRGMASPVNPARGAFLRTGSISMIGHHHQTSEHTETTLDGRTVTCWSTGCLSELHPDYARVNRWNHGFAFVETHRDQFTVSNKRIRNGSVL